MSLILASSSPYRRKMLTRLGLPFTAISPNLDETPRPQEDAAQLALRLAVEKAQTVARLNPGSIVIGSDQVAIANGQPVGKPGNLERAQAQLRTLSGQTIAFHSALCVTNGMRQETADIITTCQYRTLDDTEILNYLQREHAFDTAGSTKAEGLGIALMESMRCDDPTAIIGLPLIALCRMLRSFNLDPLASERP